MDEASPRVTGWALFWQQTHALLVKNALLAWRNRASTFLQLFASFFFILLIFCVDKAVRGSLSGISTYKNVFQPTPVNITAIPPCSSAAFMRPDCYDFIWSGNQSPVIRSLVQNITKNNPGRPIDFEAQTLGFNTSADVDSWLLANPYRTPGALHFELTPTGSIAYGVQTNSTGKQVRGRYEDPTFFIQLPLQWAAERELVAYQSANYLIVWNPATAEFAHPVTELLNVVAQSAAVFLFAAAMFNFVIQISNVVLEKETRVRQAMNTMGLLDSAYWLTWTVWEVALAFVSCILLVCFGMMFQFDFFLNNNFLVLFLLFFLFWLSMTSIAFLISTFLNKSSSANTIGFIMYIVGFIFQLVVVFGFPYDQQYAVFWRVLFSLFPPNLLALGLKYLGDATATPEATGIGLGGITKCSPYNQDCVLTLGGVYLWLAVLFVVYLLLALYLDNVLPDISGVKKSPLFCFLPSFWSGKSRDIIISYDDEPDVGRQEAAELDADVAAEEWKVRGAAAAEGAGGAPTSAALSVRGLAKTFPGKSDCCGCCGRRKPPFHAVKGSWFEVEKESLFCLLGPNGAGKSTTINCLTGIIPTTAGDGLIYGCSIRAPPSLAHIRRSMGVCPQFDILWDRLSGQEHLYLFARIKGLSAKHIPKEVEALLGEVRLVEAGSMRTSSYSGGMKRRLSVAVALIGNPSMVFLDEPTTGMDPVSRRYVWDIIERAKRGRAIVLTTHSMEEADILGDHIAIMAKGRLRCIGTSIHLKQRFGAGILVTVGFEGQQRKKGTESAAGDSVHAEEEGNGHKGAPQNGGSVPPEKDGNQNGNAAPSLPHVASQASLSDESLLDAKARVKSFFLEKLGVEPVDESRAYLRYSIPRELEGKGSPSTNGHLSGEGAGHVQSEQRLTAFFRDLKESRAQLGIVNLQLSLTSLEEVFLNIARQAELETAASEGRYETFELPSGVYVKIPVGEEKVLLSAITPKPTDGEQGPWLMSVEWQQDDDGRLRIFRTSDPTPVAQGADSALDLSGVTLEEQREKGPGMCACFGGGRVTIRAKAVDAS